MLVRSLLLLFLMPFWAVAQKKPVMLYKDPSKPVEVRVKDLLSRMTLQEKIAQMQQVPFLDLSDDSVTTSLAKIEKRLKGLSFGCVKMRLLTSEQYARAITVLQEYMVKKTRLGIPILAPGEALHGSIQNGSTIFPQSIALGSTFNPVLVNRMTNTITKELKAQSITQVLSPDLDLARELRWGRVEETYGEDPYLTFRMGVAYTKAFTSKNICKHMM